MRSTPTAASLSVRLASEDRGETSARHWLHAGVATPRLPAGLCGGTLYSCPRGCTSRLRGVGFRVLNPES